MTTSETLPRHDFSSPPIPMVNLLYRFPDRKSDRADSPLESVLSRVNGAWWILGGSDSESPCIPIKRSLTLARCPTKQFRPYDIWSVEAEAFVCMASFGLILRAQARGTLIIGTLLHRVLFSMLTLRTLSLRTLECRACISKPRLFE